MLKELAELWKFRYLLQMLIARELKVRYKNSALGFLWSIVPPLLSVVVLSPGKPKITKESHNDALANPLD